MSINFNELRELLAAIAQTDITELTLKSEDFELTVRKGIAVIPTATAPTLPEVVIPPLSVPPQKPVVTASEPSETPVPSPLDKKWVAITSPMVGTFYSAPSPDEEPFAKISDRIRLGQTVCIIEAMKLMNEIESEVAGQIVEIAIENGQPVEYGQTLMWVNPD